jgi:hypothetical protein
MNRQDAKAAENDNRTAKAPRRQELQDIKIWTARTSKKSKHYIDFIRVYLRLSAVPLLSWFSWRLGALAVQLLFAILSVSLRFNGFLRVLRGQV